MSDQKNTKPKTIPKRLLDKAKGKESVNETEEQKPVVEPVIEPAPDPKTETAASTPAPATIPSTPVPGGLPKTKPATKPDPAKEKVENVGKDKEEKSRELTTAQKISHFKKKLEGLSKLATELGGVDNRFRQIRKILNEVTKLVDPGALVQAAAVKSKRREEVAAMPLVKSVIRRPVLQATATVTKPSPRPNQAKHGSQPTPGGFNTKKPGPKIPFNAVKKKV
jgi:hypothetical protein